mmetsp:Transcript_22391/g.68957  ORF Transcript_22391/g.68957 Transcript_22391/m.68957 type:complete len:115 (-) Transcript_22391:177-521(-)
MRAVLLLVMASLLASAAAFLMAPTTTAPRSVAVLGRGDRRTRRGKIWRGTNGSCRKKKKHAPDRIVDPYFTLREWGKRQDPPLTVEEVIALKVEKLQKVKVTPEQALAAMRPIN